MTFSFVQRDFSVPGGLNIVGDVGGDPHDPAVVLLHGGGQTRHSWAGAMRRLIESGYFVVSYDARGHGESDWAPGGDYSLPTLAGDLSSIVATVEGPVALVGASMGGATAFYTIGSSDRPIARALVMVDIVLRPAQAGTDRIQKFMMAHQDGFETMEEAIDAVANYRPENPRPSNRTGLRKNLRLRDDGRLYWHWDPRLLNVSPAAEPPSFEDELAAVSQGVTIPTLMVRGAQSDVVDEDGIKHMRQLVPQTEILDVAAAGHMVVGDQNDAFNDELLSFLQRNHPSDGPRP